MINCWSLIIDQQISYRVVFFTGTPQFQYQKENCQLANQSCCSCKCGYEERPWLAAWRVFFLGSEIGGYQWKKPPCTNLTTKHATTGQGDDRNTVQLDIRATVKRDNGSMGQWNNRLKAQSDNRTTGAWDKGQQDKDDTREWDNKNGFHWRWQRNNGAMRQPANRITGQQVNKT